MATAAQQLKINRLARGPIGQPPVPQVPQLSDKLAFGSSEEKAAAIRDFNLDLIEFFKKTGTIANT